MHAPLPREIGATSAPTKREKVWIETDGLFGGWHASVFVIEKQKKWKLKVAQHGGSFLFRVGTASDRDRVKMQSSYVIDNGLPGKG